MFIYSHLYPAIYLASYGLDIVNGSVKWPAACLFVCFVFFFGQLFIDTEHENKDNI